MKLTVVNLKLVYIKLTFHLFVSSFVKLQTDSIVPVPLALALTDPSSPLMMSVMLNSTFSSGVGSAAEPLQTGMAIF